LWGAFGTAGQRCTSTSRLILEKSDWSKTFIEKLIKAANNLKIGNGLNPDNQIGPLISAEHREKVNDFVVRAIKDGAKLICGGQKLESADLQNGYFYAPTILTDIKPQMEIAKQEVFGPVLSIIEVNSFEEAIEIANNTDYGLSLSIYTQNINLAMQATNQLEAGLTYINAPTIGAECGGASAFGGWKNTGNGSREGGVLALDTYTQYKTIYLDYSEKLQKAQID